jgi:hypothetical protein
MIATTTVIAAATAAVATVSGYLKVEVGNKGAGEVGEGTLRCGEPLRRFGVRGRLRNGLRCLSGGSGSGRDKTAEREREREHTCNSFANTFL